MDEHFASTYPGVDEDAAPNHDYSDFMVDSLKDLPPMAVMPNMTLTDPAAAPAGLPMPVMPPMDDPRSEDTPAAPPVPAPAPASEPEIDLSPQDPLPAPTPEWDDADVSEPPADGTFGTPAAWSADWFYQEFDGACGPSSIAQVVSEYTGLDISDPQQLVDRALELGLFLGDDSSNGMTTDALEILMEDQGVPCHLEYSSIDDLAAKLSDGYGVIAMVDSGEIWYPGEEVIEDDIPDHALVVAGIDEVRGVVILSDPGTPDGNQMEVPIEQFADAWADSDCQMLVADAPDPDLVDTAVDPSVAALAARPWAIITLI